MVKDKWWKAAAELKAEEVLETADGKCQIVKSIIVEEKGYPVTTYNLSVEDNHTFFVGNEKVLTHNTINMLNKCNFTKASDYGKYPTIIDDKVKVIDKVDLPEWIGESFKDGNYRTVVTKENITFYRTYGGGAKVDGSFVTTTSAGNRINAKINTALVPEWKNSRQYEAVIEVPKGTTINIGRVDKQYTKTGALLEGDGDQILLPQGWPSEWIKEVREVPSR